jgi:hypothetical protein
MLTMQEAQLRELTERVRLQDELLQATVNALATICEQLPGDALEVTAKLRDLMFDRKKLTDRVAAVNREHAPASDWHAAGFALRSIREAAEP